MNTRTIFLKVLSTYSVHNLVYYEDVGDIHAAIQREKQFKRWTRKWKIELIEKENPDWHDLADDWFSA